MQTLKFEIQSTLTFSLLSITAADLLENKNVWLNRVKRFMIVCCDFNPLCRFLYFCGQPVVALIMIDSSKTRKSFSGVEVQSLSVIKRCSK